MQSQSSSDSDALVDDDSIDDDSEYFMPGAWIEGALAGRASPGLPTPPPADDIDGQELFSMVPVVPIAESVNAKAPSPAAEPLYPNPQSDYRKTPSPAETSMFSQPGVESLPRRARTGTESPSPFATSRSISLSAEPSYVSPNLEFLSTEKANFTLPPLAILRSAELSTPAATDDSSRPLSPEGPSVLEVTEEVIGLYEKALFIQYPAMTDRLEKLQRDLNNTVDGPRATDRNPVRNSTVTADSGVDENHFSCFPREHIISSYCDAIDIEQALSARQSTLLVEIGYLLGELIEALRTYDQAHSTMQSLEATVLQPTQAAAKANNFGIEFGNLKDFRSVYMPEIGESFIQRQSYLLADLEQCLVAHKHAVGRTTRFFHNPLSLRAPGAPGLSRVLSFQL